MARNLEASCKQCRREMTPLMLKGQRCLTDKCALKRKKNPPGPPKKRRAKPSEYGIQLREKQKLKNSYGLLERQFRRIFEEASRMRGVTGDNMLSLLERRLDNIIYRTGFASSRKQARQFINHRHIVVNNNIVDIPSYRVDVNSVIQVRESFKDNVMLDDSIKLSKAISSIPEWVEVDFEKKQTKILRLPERHDVEDIYKERLVVELYSK